jgi:hypothetical protein
MNKGAIGRALHLGPRNMRKADIRPDDGLLLLENDTWYAQDGCMDQGDSRPDFASLIQVEHCADDLGCERRSREYG